MKHFTDNPLILVDGSYYLHRAYHALPPLTNSMGEPTGAMYGVLNMIRRILIQYHSTHVVILFDADGKTFRNELFEHYKSHRAKIPDDLKQQIGPLYEIVKAMGLPLLSINYVEADDVIGTLALSAEREGRDVLIITDDKDLTQLVSPNITLVNTRFNLIFDPKVVQIKFGVPPELIPDYLAFTGDQSDNIPGVPGVGKKTAIALLQALGGLRSVYRHLDKISTLKFRGSKYYLTNILKKHRDTAFLSYELAKIKTDVTLNFSYTQCTVKAPNIHTLFLLFQRYEFQHWSRLLKCRDSFFLGKFDNSSTLFKTNGQ